MTDDPFPSDFVSNATSTERAVDHSREVPTALNPDLSGAVPRIEDRDRQLEFAREASFDVVMVDTYRAERLLESGETADSLFPDATVILTTTFEDWRLETWMLEREVDVSTRFGADVVIPVDTPVYETDPRRQRIDDLQIYADNVLRAVKEYTERGISVLPLVKGETEYERRICYDAFVRAGINQVAYYCAQYFLYGWHYRQLLTDVQDIVREFDPEHVMLIGFQSENYLPDFPPAVDAAAGFRWFWQSGLSDEPLSVAVRNYNDWERKVNSSLQTGQSLLGSFASEPVYGGH